MKKWSWSRRGAGKTNDIGEINQKRKRGYRKNERHRRNGSMLFRDIETNIVQARTRVQPEQVLKHTASVCKLYMLKVVGATSYRPMAVPTTFPGAIVAALKQRHRPSDGTAHSAAALSERVRNRCRCAPHVHSSHRYRALCAGRVWHLHARYAPPPI